MGVGLYELFLNLLFFFELESLDMKDNEPRTYSEVKMIAAVTSISISKTSLIW